jgi:peptide/nickel transport system substrate-binding protein
MRRLAALALVFLMALVAGCGEDDAALPPAGALASGSGGELAWAVAERPTTLDPLFARTAADRLAARQVFEPPVEQLSGPYGDPRRVDGLVLAVSQTSDPRVWRLRLRTGVRFRDGTPFNAAAVLANAERWQAYPELSGLAPPPEVFVFAPKPDEVRFKLAQPDPDFDRALASPALGIVSPEALRRAGGGELRYAQIADAGTGAFEPRERSADRLLLARNAGWWGSGRPALGPAIDQLEFVLASSERERVALLRRGEVQAASALGPGARRAVRRDPLLAIASTAGKTAIGAERSVRGIPTDEAVPSLNGVWQTRIGG